MKLLSIDIETTGLDHEHCQILEIGAVLFDPAPIPGKSDPWKFFECLVKHDRYVCEPFAAQLNCEIFKELSGVKKTHIPIYSKGMASAKFSLWLQSLGVNNDGNTVTVVGKNYSSFDSRFLEKLPNWSFMPFERRVLDLGSLFFQPGDQKIKDLKGCLEKVGVSVEIGHRALQDAQDVATAITRYFA